MHCQVTLTLRYLLFPLIRCPGAPEWPAGSRPQVRELLALSTPYYFGLVPEQTELAANYSNMWDQASLNPIPLPEICWEEPCKLKPSISSFDKQ